MTGCMPNIGNKLGSKYTIHHYFMCPAGSFIPEIPGIPTARTRALHYAVSRLHVRLLHLWATAPGSFALSGSLSPQRMSVTGSLLSISSRHLMNAYLVDPPSPPGGGIAQLPGSRIAPGAGYKVARGAVRHKNCVVSLGSNKHAGISACKKRRPHC